MNTRYVPSRRDALKLGAASLAAASFAPAVAGALEQPDEYGGLPMGIQSYSLRSLSLDNALAALHNDLKLTEIELYPRHISGLSPAQVNEKLKAHGVRCVSFGVVPFGKDH